MVGDGINDVVVFVLFYVGVVMGGGVGVVSEVFFIVLMGDRFL